MRPALLALTAALALLAGTASAQTAPPRYAVEVSVIAQGVTIASGRTTIAESGQAEVVLTGADGQYLFTADLQPEEGDGGDGRLVLEAYLNHDGADMARPNLILKRGARAVMQMGSRSDGAAELTEGVEIEITPIPAT